MSSSNHPARGTKIFHLSDLDRAGGAINFFPILDGGRICLLSSPHLLVLRALFYTARVSSSSPETKNILEPPDQPEVDRLLPGVEIQPIAPSSQNGNGHIYAEDYDGLTLGRTKGQLIIPSLATRDKRQELDTPQTG